jgi:hypothetical protein
LVQISITSLSQSESAVVIRGLIQFILMTVFVFVVFCLKKIMVFCLDDVDVGRVVVADGVM